MPLCSCGVLEAETTEHFLLRCPAYTNCRKVLLDDVKNIFPSILSFPESDISNILLYGADAEFFSVHGWKYHRWLEVSLMVGSIIVFFFGERIFFLLHMFLSFCESKQMSSGKESVFHAQEEEVNLGINYC